MGQNHGWIPGVKENEFFFHAIRTGEILYPERDGVFNKEVRDTVDFWSVSLYVRDMIDARKARFKEKDVIISD